MYQDEALRVAAQIRRTIPQEVARVIEVENQQPLCIDTWSIRCYEIRRPFGGPGAHVWIPSIAYWLHLQERWLARGGRQNTQS